MPVNFGIMRTEFLYKRVPGRTATKNQLHSFPAHSG